MSHNFRLYLKKIGNSIVSLARLQQSERHFVVFNYEKLYDKNVILPILAICFCLISFSCQESTKASIESNVVKVDQNQNRSQENVTVYKPSNVSEILLPEGYKRIEDESNFAVYLRSLPLDTLDDVVHLYNGERKGNQNAQYAVIKMDVGERDLQQCADAVMRLRAEQWYQAGQYDRIKFMFTNGDWVDFVKYAEGFRPKISGNKITWSKSHAESYSYTTFRVYMDLVFTYAGTLSLSRQLEPVPDFNDMAIGDVIIIGGSPGHAVIIVDMAIEVATNKKVFMIAQSYMPAQEIHILKNPINSALSPWYEIPDGERITTPEYLFTKQNLMRFAD